MASGSNQNDGTLRTYWRAYGGLRSIAKSIYFRVAVLLTLTMFPLWVSGEWWDTTLSVLPNLLGFTLGGYALLVSFGDEKFKAFLIETEGETAGGTAFIEVSAGFLHFILVQALALVVSLLAKSFDSTPPMLHALGIVGPSFDAWWASAVGFCVLCVWWFVGYALFSYSVCLVVATAIGIFQVTGWFNDHQKLGGP